MRRKDAVGANVGSAVGAGVAQSVYCVFAHLGGLGAEGEGEKRVARCEATSEMG